MTQTMLTLAKGEFAVFEPAGTEAVRVHAGTVWLTQERDPDDHFLAAGTARALNPQGSVCIQAREDTVLALVPRGVRQRAQAHGRPAARLGWVR